MAQVLYLSWNLIYLLENNSGETCRLSPVFLALRTCWVLRVISCITLSSQTVTKPRLRGNQSLLGLAHVLCRAKNDEERQSTEQWEMMEMSHGASVLPLCDPLATSSIPLQPQGSAVVSPVCSWKRHPRSPLGFHCVTAAVPGPVQKGTGSAAAVGALGCAHPHSHHLTCSPLQTSHPWSPGPCWSQLLPVKNPQLILGRLLWE